MNGISQQRNVGFGLNTRQLKSFLNSPEAKELGVSIRQEKQKIAVSNSEEAVNARVLSLVQKGDVLNLNNGHGVSVPLQESGKGALERLAAKLQDIKGTIIPSKADFDTRVCFRPLSEVLKAGSEKLKAAISKAAK